MEAKMTISESGLVDLDVRKVKDGSHLGKLKVTLDINKLDEIRFFLFLFRY